MAIEATHGGSSPGLDTVPGWDRFPWLRAGFSTRVGGQSQAYGLDEQNLGWTAEDNAATVRAARSAFAERVTGGVALPLITVQQVHGAVVRDLEQEATPWKTDEGKATLEGDGLISLTPGRLVSVLTADCVPVLVADTRTHAVGAFHAGWRGTLAQVVRHGLEQMSSRYGSRPEDVVAAIGPCIGPCCFEVGKEVREAFKRESAGAGKLFAIRDSSLHMDLVTANCDQLLASGVAPQNVTAIGECTACTRLADGRRKYFSYRAEAGRTGRMLNGIAALA